MVRYSHDLNIPNTSLRCPKIPLNRGRSGGQESQDGGRKKVESGVYAWPHGSAHAAGRDRATCWCVFIRTTIPTTLSVLRRLQHYYMAGLDFKRHTWKTDDVARSAFDSRG